VAKENLSELDSLEKLESLVDFSSSLSMRTQDRRCTWEQQEISLAFARVCITALSFLRLIPGSSWFSEPKGLAIWDISSAASLVRNVMEGYYVMVYLAIPNYPAEHPDFKRLLWLYHEAFERKQMISISLPSSTNLPLVEGLLAAAEVELKASPFFQVQKQRRQDEFLGGKDFMLLSKVDLSKTAGISERYFRAEYKKCSAFAHSAPFSLNQLGAFSAGSPESVALFRSLVRTTSAYIAFALRDFAKVFSENLPIEITKIISFWENIMKWERNPHFDHLRPASPPTNSP
jgi:hypothetical protein